MHKGQPLVSSPGIVMLVMILSMAIIAGMVHGPGEITGQVSKSEISVMKTTKIVGLERKELERVQHLEKKELEKAKHLAEEARKEAKKAAKRAAEAAWKASKRKNVCGNGRCEVSETCSSCAQDCGKCPVFCGDGSCNGVELCSSCSIDCGACPPVCGNGKCDLTESCSSCAKDCGVCLPKCGDHVCNVDESCSSCPGDCGACPPRCGDGSCNGNESCSSCSGDCGACPPRCGDGSCNGVELCSSCPSDCGVCPAVCSNGKCEDNETCSSCSSDCGVCPPICGDGTCNSNETCSSCPGDCGACQKTYPCTDSDGGKNYAVQGITSGSKLSWDPSNTQPVQLGDICVDFLANPDGQVVSACSSSSGCKVDEYFCQNDVINNEYVLCPYGCQIGACLATPPASCTDSIKNQDETDIDCGGSKCSKCSNSKKCLAASDCQSSNCVNGLCQPIVYCGDGSCNGNENCSSCPGDCGVCPVVCGNAKCESGESCSSCSSDCGACQTNQSISKVCGDGVCGGNANGETCSTCLQDCGQCKQVCGTGGCVVCEIQMGAITPLFKEQ